MVDRKRMQEQLDDMEQKLDDLVGGISGQLEEFEDRFEELLEKVQERLPEQAADLMKRTREVGADLRERLAKASEQMREVAKDAADKVVSAVPGDDSADQAPPAAADPEPAGEAVSMDWTRAEMYKRATELDLDGRSKMNKKQLYEALRAAE